MSDIQQLTTIAEIREYVFTEYSTDDRCFALPHPQWYKRGLALSREHRIAQFAVADWILEGIELVGATRAHDFAEAVFPQYARATFHSWVTVARHFSALCRIESDWLTFGHYQVAQGAESSSAEEMVWLRKADEHKMSVSALREAISHAFELRHEAFLNEHPELKPEPEPIKPEPIKKKDCYGAEVKEFKTDWLKKQTRWSLDELARARRVTTEQLLQRVIQDFLDAHSDEIGNAKVAEAKRSAEHFASMDGAEAVEKVKREANERYRRECQERAEKDRAEKAELNRQADAKQERYRRKQFLMQALTDAWIPEVSA